LPPTPTPHPSSVPRRPQIKREAKKEGKKVPIEAIKRFPGTPKPGYFVSSTTSEGAPQYVAPTPFDEMI
jgi:hypothetical protein